VRLNLKNKKGQIAIWVIVAMMIVAVILIYYLISRKVTTVNGDINPDQDPQGYIQRCAISATQEAVSKMLPQGGFVNPDNYIYYNEIKISYLCRNNGNYLPCINQHPMYLFELKKELLNYVKPKVEQCFVDVKDNFERNGFVVSLDRMEMNIELAQNRILLYINRPLKISKGIEVKNYNNFDNEVNSALYDLAVIANEIADQEARYCYFEYVGYMILYPKVNIAKVALGDSTKIYTLKDKSSGQKLNFAIRSCAIPPGI
jgi:hypothetical protein